MLKVQAVDRLESQEIVLSIVLWLTHTLVQKCLKNIFGEPINPIQIATL